MSAYVTHVFVDINRAFFCGQSKDVVDHYSWIRNIKAFRDQGRTFCRRCVSAYGRHLLDNLDEEARRVDQVLNLLSSLETAAPRAKDYK